jgi:alkylation response protein AidB-like acyl-CoA dehydrogenase
LAKQWDGLEATDDVIWEASERLAAACGVTHFVQTQHIGAMGFLAKSQNLPLAEANLAAWRRGDCFCGVAFAHLRRAQSPVTVRREGESWIFNGEAPWFTGWGLMDQVVLAGRRTDQPTNIYVLVSTTAPGIAAGPPLELAAMNASRTVTLRLNDVRVPQSQWVLEQTPEEMQERDLSTLLRFAAPPLGVVRAACKLMGSPWAEKFSQHSAQLRDRALAWRGEEKEATGVRTSANQLALHAAQAAVVVGGGNSNRLDHPAQRLLREASFYYLTQLTVPLREAALNRLTALEMNS